MGPRRDQAASVSAEPLSLPSLTRAGVDVDVLLARQPLHRVHDLVGHGPLDLAVVGDAGVAREVQRLADADADADRAPEAGADGVRLVRPDHRHGDDGHAGLERHARHPGAALEQPAVGRARALGVDAEQPALAQHADAGVERRARRASVAALDRDLAHAGEEPALEGAEHAGLREVLRLGGEGHPARHHQGQDEGVEHREVVGRDQRAAPRRQVLRPHHARPERHAHERAEQHPLHDPVQHSRSRPPRPRRRARA